MIVAGRFASSLMQLAAEQNKLEAVRKDMQMIRQICDDNREFAMFIASPVIKKDKKITVLQTLLRGNIDDLSLSFVRLIASKGRESLLPEIASAFDEQYKKHKNILTATVITANGLDSKMREKVLELVRTQMKGEVELKEKVDPSTIGGFILKVGDRQIDRSVARQLNTIRKELINSN